MYWSIFFYKIFPYHIFAWTISSKLSSFCGQYEHVYVKYSPALSVSPKLAHGMPGQGISLNGFGMDVFKWVSLSCA